MAVTCTSGIDETTLGDSPASEVEPADRVFSGLSGCVSAGSTLDEARAMAVEALALHLEGMIEDGEAMPESSSLEAVMADDVNRDGVAILVHAPAVAAPGVG